MCLVVVLYQVVLFSPAALNGDVTLASLSTATRLQSNAYGGRFGDSVLLTDVTGDGIDVTCSSSHHQTCSLAHATLLCAGYDCECADVHHTVR
jgi:hypothetical protein